MFTPRAAALLLALTATALPAPKAQAYPIDCAILLCLAGGFPPSAECMAAKATMIRRITPWPVTPPLQLWNCPLGLPAGFVPAPGSPEIRLGPDGLTDEVRGYRDAIEIYHIRVSSYRSDGNTIWIDQTERGEYQSDGSHHWRRASFFHGPAWLADTPGALRAPLQVCHHENRDGACEEWRIIRHENRPASWWLRGVAMRFEDHEGRKHTEFVNY